MTTMGTQITSLTIVYSTVYSDADQRKHQSSASLAFVWEIHRDRWIPRTKGQLRGICFRLMTSSWNLAKAARYVLHWSYCFENWKVSRQQRLPRRLSNLRQWNIKSKQRGFHTERDLTIRRFSVKRFPFNTRVWVISLKLTQANEELHNKRVVRYHPINNNENQSHCPNTEGDITIRRPSA